MRFSLQKDFTCRLRDPKRLDRVNCSKFRRGEGKFNFMEQKNDDCILDPISLAMLRGLCNSNKRRLSSPRWTHSTGSFTALFLPLSLFSLLFLLFFPPSGARIAFHPLGYRFYSQERIYTPSTQSIDTSHDTFALQYAPLSTISVASSICFLHFYWVKVFTVRTSYNNSASFRFTLLGRDKEVNWKRKWKVNQLCNYLTQS